ncbi:MAG: CPBP family intramembrane metalloprotease [Verrucomicrobia bacterium]|nr:CPBP family intramembrane metalloprotease [Verrucomicrobiota bacterium]
MRPVVAIFLFLATVLLGGALIAPWAWNLMQWAATQSDSLKPWADAPFHRYVSRCFLIVALAGLWPFLRAVGARSFRDAGLCRSADSARQVVLGLAIGFGSLALVGLAGLLAGARTLHLEFSSGQWAAHLGNATLSAVVVAVLEELLFRGAIFAALRKSLALPAAIGLSSAIYAALHFFQRSESSGPVEWSSGLALLPRMLRGFGAVQDLIPAFPNLLLAGVILAMLFVATGSLWVSIGVHAGWIFLQKTHALVTIPAPGPQAAFWGTGKLVDGWPAAIVLATVVAVIWVRSIRNPRVLPPREPSELP